MTDLPHRLDLATSPAQVGGGRQLSRAARFETDPQFSTCAGRSFFISFPHQPLLSTKNPQPGALSRWLLWGESRSLARNTAAFRRRFRLQ